MLASEFIITLQNYIEEHGDHEVLIEGHDCIGGYYMNEATVFHEDDLSVGGEDFQNVFVVS